MTPFFRTSVLLLASLLLCLWIFTFTTYPKYLRDYWSAWNNVKEVYQPWTIRENCTTTRPLPRILLWTAFYNSWISGLSNAKKGEVMTKGCAQACHITNDRSLLSSSDGIVFHVRDIDMNDLPQRSPFQKWVFWCMEPPPYSMFSGFKYMGNMFNWTMTYRLDSDVYVPYGRFVERNDVSRQRDQKALWDSKSEMAVWMVSHCDTDGKREAYVEELKKHIGLHIYGSCGSHKCPQSRGKACYHDFERKYFFMLAFENSLCQDYATEKFFTALKYDMVPVVFGSANYSRLAPPRSYVDALSFRSPKALAIHLKRVAKDFKVYSSYLEWKTRYKIEPWSEEFCDVCSKLHSKDFVRPSTYADMYDWWGKRGRCRTWKG